MTFRLSNDQLDKHFILLLNGLENNAYLNRKREIVNSLDPLDKYKLLKMFLSHEKGVSAVGRLNSLAIFLDDRTKFFSFIQAIDFRPERTYQNTIASILEIIPKQCSTIETIDFRSLTIRNKDKENFKSFLKNCPQMKSLWVKCYGQENDCAMSQLLFKEDFRLHDPAVQWGLLKIEYIDGEGLDASQCAILLKLLPNLKSFGRQQNLGQLLLPCYNYDRIFYDKLLNISEFADEGTNFNSLDIFSKLCPHTTQISLTRPEKHVIANLWKFPLITEIIVSSQDPDAVSEIVYLLNLIGPQIHILELNICGSIQLDPGYVHGLCPYLLKLVIRHTFPNSVWQICKWTAQNIVLSQNMDMEFLRRARGGSF